MIVEGFSVVQSLQRSVAEAVATEGLGGQTQSAPLDSEKFAKNQEKEGENQEKQEKNRECSFTLPHQTDRTGYATDQWTDLSLSVSG